MPRDRHQKGYVRLVGKTVRKWKGFFLVATVYTYFRSVIAESIDEEFLERNPCRKLTSPRSSTGRANDSCRS